MDKNYMTLGKLIQGFRNIQCYHNRSEKISYEWKYEKNGGAIRLWQYSGPLL